MKKTIAILTIFLIATSQASASGMKFRPSSGGSGTPGGQDKDIQFNAGGSFSGDSAIQWSKEANTLIISRDSGQVGSAILISNESGTRLANVSHDGSAFFQNLQLANALPVASGGTGLTSGTSGGVLGFTGTGSIASSSLLTGNAVVIGGGSGVLPTSITADTSTSHVLFSTATSPAFRNFNSNDVSAGVFGSNFGGTGQSSYTKGDLLVGTSTGLLKLAVGSMGQILSVDTGSAAGVKWVATPSSSGTPGGSTGQVQFNNGASFGGASLVSVDTAGTRLAIGPGTNPGVSLDVAGSFRTVPFTLTDGAGISIDASRSNFFIVTLGGTPRTLANPTNGVPNQKIILLVSQDATGSRKLLFDSGYKFGSDVPSYDASTTANTKDYIGMIISNAQSVDIVSVSKGYR